MVVEGHSDAGFVDAICERVNVECKVVVSRGNRPEKIGRIIKVVDSRLGRVIVLKDEHRLGSRDLTKLLNLLKTMLRELKVKGEIIVVSKSIESWILAGLCEKSAEDILDPVEKLREKIGRLVPKTREAYYKLTQRIDIDHASKTSGKFKEFLQILQSKE